MQELCNINTAMHILDKLHVFEIQPQSVSVDYNIVGHDNFVYISAFVTFI